MTKEPVLPVTEAGETPPPTLGQLSVLLATNGATELTAQDETDTFPAAMTSGAKLSAQASFRRHHRKRSSTIFIQPRAINNVLLVEQEAPAGLLKGVTSLAGAQLFSKLLTFLLNQLLIRFLGSRDLGAASQLDLLLSTSLSLSRDALRLASQRQSVERDAAINSYTTDGRAVLGTLVGRRQEAINLGWLAALLGTTIVGLISAFISHYDAWPRNALLLTALAAVVELATEPCFLLMQMRVQLSRRARAESIANFARVFGIAFSLLVLHTQPFTGFALGHCCYAFTLATMYFRWNASLASRDGFSLLPVKLWAQQDQTTSLFVSDAIWRTSVELLIQQIMKYFLTEGDKLAVSVMTTLEEQGEYALASNYGALLARLVFLPMEEALRSYFTREFPKSDASGFHHSPLYSPAQESEKEKESTPQPGTPESSPNSAVGTPNGSPPPSPRSTSTGGARVAPEKLRFLTTVLRMYTYLGILAAGFGPLVASYVLRLVVRASSFGNATRVLAAYAVYIPVLAWNGVLDALVQSVASLATLRTQGLILAGLAGVFVVLTYIFVSVLGMGAVGLVWAQITGMALRMGWSACFATSYFGGRLRWLASCIPEWWVCAIAGVAIATGRLTIGSAVRITDCMKIMALAGVVVGAAAVAEREHIIALIGKFHSYRHANRARKID